MDDTRLYAKVVHASFPVGTLAIHGTEETTLSVDALLTITAIRIGLAETRNSRASKRVWFTAEILHTAALGFVIVHLADGIRTTLNFVTSVLAEEETTSVRDTGSIGSTISISIRTRVRVSATIFSLDVRLTDVLRWTSTGKGAQRIGTASKLMARIGLAETDSCTATSIGITRETRKTLAVGVVGVGNADGICSTAIDARIVAGMSCRAGPI